MIERTRTRPLAVICFAAVLIASCTRPVVETTTPDPDEAVDREAILVQQAMPQLIREAEDARELELTQQFETRVMTGEEIREFVTSELDDVDMSEAQIIMEVFGFLPDGADLHQEMVNLLSAEVVGMYEPRNDTMMVLRDIASQLESQSEESVMARMVLVHELTHALQDQHFETLNRTQDEAWSDDAGAVTNFLVEGGATLTMLVATIRASGAPFDPTLLPDFRARIQEMGDQAVPQSEGMSQAPPYFGFTMAAFYLEGAGFVADLRRLGGWEAVNEAHRNPPRATRDVLHTEHYLTGARIFEIQLPDQLPSLEEPGCRRVITATLGEVETAAFLLSLGDNDRARAAAEGWAGDSFAVFQREGGGLALAWRLRFEDSDEAREFQVAARDAMVAANRGPCYGVEDPSPEAGSIFHCDQATDWLERRGSDVAVVRGVPEPSVPAVARALLEAPATERRVDPPQPALLERWERQKANTN